MTEDNINDFTQNDYDIVKREVVYQGVFRMVRCQLRYRLFNGGWSDTISREVMERKPAVSVLPYDPVLDQVVLIEQFRPGALHDRNNPWLIEVVAGIFETTEQPPDVAIREAKEEANCDILDLYPICEYFVSPGGSDEYLYLFCGRIDASLAGGIYGLPEEHEDIRSFTLSADAAFNMVEKGQIKTAPAMTSLLWLKLNRERLRQLWQTT